MIAELFIASRKILIGGIKDTLLYMIVFREFWLVNTLNTCYFEPFLWLVNTTMLL